jgi:DNA-binding transcriptional MerR regulator
VAAASGVSVRTLHFYDKAGMLKPAYHGANGYRFYEEPQLLVLQQILFYREMGFQLKQIKKVLSHAGFEIVEELKPHRDVMQKKLARTLELMQTIDNTIQHLTGKKKMESDAMFAGFAVAAGEDRFNERIMLGAKPMIANFQHRIPAAQRVFSSLRAPVAGRATFITRRMSGSM